jgi:hypothetical protein
MGCWADRNKLHQERSLAILGAFLKGGLQDD